MTNSLTIVDIIKPETMERLLIGGNLKTLTSSERLQYYKHLCESLKLNPLSRPFDYLEFQGKLALYANKGCAEQLRQNHGVSINITAREAIGDVYVVTARARLPSGREDESTGAVPIAGLKGDALANAYLKAETKAKRRVTLSVCGLNMLDETEVETIKDAKTIPADSYIESKTKPDAQTAPATPEEDPEQYEIPYPLKNHGFKLAQLPSPDIKESMEYWEKRGANTPTGKVTGKPAEFLKKASLCLENRARARLSEPRFEDDENFGDMP